MTETTNPFSSIKEVPISSWERLSQNKIYFGHKSVGNNIIEGIKDVMEENPEIKLNILQTSNPDDFDSGIFAHSGIGRNFEPNSKVDEFIEFMEKGIGDKADIAGLKFCFVDIRPDSNIQDIFNYYDNGISQIKMRHPGMIIIHFTVPLVSNETGPRSWVKRLIGRSINRIEDNVNRNRFNEMLLNKYKGIDPVFDLATLESTFPDGKRSSFNKDGKTYYSLVPEYTYDSGHLNEKGRKMVAEQFLIFLANL